MQNSILECAPYWHVVPLACIQSHLEGYITDSVRSGRCLLAGGQCTGCCCMMQEVTCRVPLWKMSLVLQSSRLLRAANGPNACECSDSPSSLYVRAFFLTVPLCRPRWHLLLSSLPWRPS